MEKQKLISTKESNVGRYTNEKSLAKVQGKRIDNYSEEILKAMEQYSEEIGSVIYGYNYGSTDKTMALNLLRRSTVKIQNRGMHQEMVAGLATECAKKLGLNVGLTRIMAYNHDVGHTFFGHNGERWLTQVKKEYGLGVYVHNALGPKELIYRHNIYDEIMNRIKILNPKITEGELTRIRKGLWLIFDGINSHNGELTENEYIPNFEKTKSGFEEEIMKCSTIQGFDKTLRPATTEGALIRVCDKMAYTPFDMLDGLHEGMIDKIDDEYATIFTELGITKKEIDTANITKNFGGIARKLHVTFLRSVIENSSRSVIRMDPQTSKRMHEIRDVNNKKIVKYAVLREEQEIYPKAIRTLMNHFADLILHDFFSVEDIKNVKYNMILANSFMRKHRGTPNEGFASYIVDTTPEIYNYNEEMISRVMQDEKTSREMINIDFDRRKALEFGAEYLSTLNDFDFFNLLVAQKIITEEQKKSLTRQYKDIGIEGLKEEACKGSDWEKIAEGQRKATALLVSKNEDVTR